MNTFYIPGELMSLNEFINIQRTHPMKGNQVKLRNTKRCKRAVLEAIQQGLSFELPVRLSITWYMKNRRKDPDNIAFAVKFILDGLVNAGALPNDGWNEIVEITHHFVVDAKQPRVEVSLYSKEIEGATV